MIGYLSLLLLGPAKGFVVPVVQSPIFLSARWASSSPSEDEKENPFEEQIRRMRENVEPTLPTSGGRPAISKSDIYGEEELEGLWQIHKQLSSSPESDSKRDESAVDKSFDPPGISSIHDLVMEAIEDIDSESSSTDDKYDDVSPPTSSYSWWTDEIRQRSTQITTIASDVDGTLIGSDQKIHPRTKAAIESAVQSAFSPMGGLKWFFPATGKTRAGAMNSLGPELAALLMSCPGVFIQGLYCVIGDTVVFEKKLDQPAIEACEKLVSETGTSIIAYDGDTLYTTALTQTVINLHEIYGEPLSKEIPSIAALSGGVHKMLVCDEDTEKLVKVVRPQLEELAAATNARVTQAVPTMLELIPEGCSKALGVEKVCEKLGVDPRIELLALGDAENDVEMLEMACIGVVMGNGSPPARKAGDIVLDETSSEGGAGVAIELLALKDLRS